MSMPGRTTSGSGSPPSDDTTYRSLFDKSGTRVVGCRSNAIRLPSGDHEKPVTVKSPSVSRVVSLESTSTTWRWFIWNS